MMLFVCFGTIGIRCNVTTTANYLSFGLKFNVLMAEIWEWRYLVPLESLFLLFVPSLFVYFHYLACKKFLRKCKSPLKATQNWKDAVYFEYEFSDYLLPYPFTIVLCVVNTCEAMLYVKALTLQNLITQDGEENSLYNFLINRLKHFFFISQFWLF